MRPVPDIMKRRIADLEAVMRSHFRKRFESKRPVETIDDANTIISIMEKVRVFIVYPNSEWARTQRQVAKFEFERLKEWYEVEK